MKLVPDYYDFEDVRSKCWLTAPWYNLRDNRKTLLSCSASPGQIFNMIQILHRIKCIFFPLLCGIGPIINIVCIYVQEWQNSIQKNAGLAFIELVNEGRWVTPLIVSFPVSSLSATFQFHQSSIASQTPSLNLYGDRVALYDSGQKKKKSIITGGGGGRLKWRLGEEGWTIFEFKSPFNTCPSQWDLGKGERSGRRWEGLWSLVPLWHIGNGSWFPPIRLSVFVFLVYLPVGIFSVCHCLCFLPVFSILPVSLHFSLIRFSPSFISFTYKPFSSRYWSLALTITRL